MEEDDVGIQRELGHRHYVPCARCGKMVASQDTILIPGDALEDHSEYAYLCMDCQAALADGEQDLPLPPL
ncbi:MAG: hypothetical protein IVW57_13405 [Ktedonobacterales bacterium]|nr:hypothetical protein [Ktedonobacterales bacterium]